MFRRNFGEDYKRIMTNICKAVKPSILLNIVTLLIIPFVYDVIEVSNNRSI